MIYECENCGKEFEVDEPKCPKCHSEDVIEYNEKEYSLFQKNDVIDYIKDENIYVCAIEKGCIINKKIELLNLLGEKE